MTGCLLGTPNADIVINISVVSTANTLLKIKDAPLSPAGVVYVIVVYKLEQLSDQHHLRVAISRNFTMFFRFIAFFALLAVAFANPKPDPQVLAYTAPAVFPAAASAYYGSGYYPNPYVGAAYPYAYNYFVK
ncbi:unnamed protein product [Leptidea sinapis]|uniref:Uncharacterized protein n=1 Tax=Leptidea sinapis TaxID=189913 RepID=A0A5E4QT29_9NEOP|nr:unnamed protein product [Leptidea sinapis]